MQPDVQEKDEPAGGSYRSIGVAAASEVCPIQEENSSLPTAQPGERQSDLIIDDPRKSRKWRLDPGWKPSWAEWLKWKGWRRVTNDRRLSDSGHRLWFYLYDTKDNDGIIEGDRADASFIAAKFGWRRQKVYQLLENMQGCGYAMIRKLSGCCFRLKLLYGVNELPKGPVQQDLPFLIPTAVRSSVSGTPGGSSCAQNRTPAVPDQAARSSVSGTPYISSVEVFVEKECDGPAKKREDWQILGVLKGIREEIARARNKPDELRGLKEKEGQLQRELAGNPKHLAQRPTAAAVGKEACDVSPSPDPPGPDPSRPDYQAWIDAGFPDYEQWRKTRKAIGGP